MKARDQMSREEAAAVDVIRAKLEELRRSGAMSTADVMLVKAIFDGDLSFLGEPKLMEG